MTSDHQSVDQVFADGVESTAASGLSEGPALPEMNVSLLSWQTEHEWIQEERKRLEAYTLSQFALIKQQREELLGRRSGIEEALALREQEMNRQLRLLADGAETLERRNRELAERETALAEQMAKLDQARRELQAVQQVNARLHQENEAQLLLGERLRLELSHLQEAVRSARSELAIAEPALQRRKQAADEEWAELTATRRQLEQRFASLEKAEESLRRRVAETDQMEAQIRYELDQRERQLALEHQELERTRAALRPERTHRLAAAHAELA